LKAARAIVFDVDGVLVDATDWHFEALNRALEPFGTSITRQEHETEFLGLPTAVKLERLIQQGRLSPKAAPTIAQLKRSYFHQILVQRCRPNNTTSALLRSLRAEKFALGAASNAIRSSVIEMLRLSGLLDYLNAIVCGDDVSRPKPDPEIYLRCSALLHVIPEDCLAVEDGQYGIQAATAAGVRVLRVQRVADVNLSYILDAAFNRSMGVDANAKEPDACG
jgi:beta-phosphoglucomutase